MCQKLKNSAKFIVVFFFCSWVIFQFIYAISFPMYGYYCVAEPNASRLSFCRKDYAKEAFVVVSGLTLAGLSIAVGIYNSGAHHLLDHS